METTRFAAADSPRVPWSAWLVAAGTMIVYTITAYRTVPFWDAGEFIATSHILGIPHQPSTPVYVLLGRIASLIPLGSVPFRVNMLSAVAGTVAVLFTHLTVLRLARRLFPGARFVQESAAVIASLFCAFAGTLWFNALEAEVYALSGAVIALSIWAVVRWRDEEPRDDGVLLVLVFVLGLSIGVHLGTLLVLPGLALLVARHRPRAVMNPEALLGWFLLVTLGFLVLNFFAWPTPARWGLVMLLAGVTLVLTRGRLNTRFAGWALALLFLGISAHLFLLIRAGLNPGINEADPSTWGALMDTLQRKQYPVTNLFIRRAPLGFQFDHMFLRYVREQWVLLPWAAVAGLPALLLCLWGGIAHSRRDRSGFLMMCVHLVIMGPFLVLYLNFTAEEVRERDYFFAGFYQVASLWIGLGAGALAVLAGKYQRVAALAMVVIGLALPVRGWRAHDRSEDTIAYDYAYNMLVSLPQGAILFTNGDNDTFPVWYLQHVEDFRKDVRVVNLSLLNTQWYIRQIRDGNPGADLAPVPLELSDDEIAALRPRVDEKTGKILYVKDLMVTRILEANAWRDPVYIAVTVPDRMGLESQLTMECLAHRIGPEPTAQRVNLEACIACVGHLFRPLNGILDAEGRTDESLVKTTTELRLVRNYAAIYFYMAIEYDRRGETEEALAAALSAEAIVPGYSGNRHFLGLLYQDLGRPDEAERHYRQALAVKEDDFRTHHALGSLLATQGRLDAGLAHLERAVQLAGPERFEPYVAAFEVLVALGQRDRALAILDAWLRFHPDDERVREGRERFRRGELEFGGAPPGVNEAPGELPEDSP